jgi:ferric-dicitrate binding protein FerR (iron transport regulator)
MNEELKENNEVPGQDAYRVAYLIAGYISNSLSEAEKDELDEWVTASDENMQLFAELTDEKNIEKGLKERGLYNADKAVERLKQKIGTTKKKQAKPISFFAVGIAASILLLAGLYFFTPLFHKNKTKVEAPIANADLIPGSDKAILTLPGGKQIILDSSKGTILQKEDLQVTNTDGSVSYRGTAAEPEWHTLTIPRGGQYQLVLADGSKVWLNAESSIRFPTAFTGKERRVEMTGEVNFEVVHHEQMPFIVMVNGIEVEDLGTEFTINAYADEPVIKTTLIAGSIRIAKGRNSALLKPGQQAVVPTITTGAQDDQKISIVNEVDLDEVTGWKKGLFEFKNARIEDIMRQVARWYDVTVRYEAKPDYHFNASIERNVPVSKLFHLLELTDQVHFSIQDKTVIVKP